MTQGMKHTEKTKKKISQTCKAKGIGKWMTGRKRPEELKKRQSEVMKKLVAEGKHNFYIDGRSKLPCPNCGGKKWRSRNQCAKCAIKRKDQHWNWQGGITGVNHTIRTSTEMKLWREAVFKRDNWTCIWCGSKKKIEADHIKSFAYFPELRFAIDNGRTLCRECHIKTFKDIYK